jgi:nitroreductase/dihydropteridine reductase
MDLLEQLQWRYAVKQFKGAGHTDPAVVESLIEATRLSPSAAGLQPYHLVLVSNRELLARLADHAMMNKDKINSADGLFVLAIQRELSLEAFSAHFSQLAALGLIPPIPEAEFAMRHQRFMARLPTPEAFQTWAHKQAYLALGTLLTSCAVLGVDACPMEGFDNARFDEILGLTERALHSSVILAYGVRSASDPGQFRQKYRRAREQFLLHYP